MAAAAMLSAMLALACAQPAAATYYGYAGPGTFCAMTPPQRMRLPAMQTRGATRCAAFRAVR